MKRNTALIIGIFVVLAIANTIIRRFYDQWSGTGLLLTIVITVPLLTVAFALFPRNIPKTEKEAKDFKWKGWYNPLLLGIVFLIISIIWTYSYISGADIHVLAPVATWIITILLFHFWLQVRKY